MYSNVVKTIVDTLINVSPGIYLVATIENGTPVSFAATKETKNPIPQNIKAPLIANKNSFPIFLNETLRNFTYRVNATEKRSTTNAFKI